MQRQASEDDYVRVAIEGLFSEAAPNCSDRRKTFSKEFSEKLKISLKTANAIPPRGARRTELSSHERDIKQSRVIMRHQASSDSAQWAWEASTWPFGCESVMKARTRVYIANQPQNFISDIRFVLWVS